MDIRSMANAASSTINANVAVTLLRSTGYTMGAGRKQVPSYAAPVTGYAQIQALDGKDLQQLEGLNIQGTIRAIYLRGELAGVSRPEQTGGDKLTIDGQEWLVVKVLEHWPTWTKAAIALQGGQ